MKATERLPWLTLERFYKATREEQVLLLTYAQERDFEESEIAAAGTMATMGPAIEAIGTRVE